MNGGTMRANLPRTLLCAAVFTLVRRVAALPVKTMAAGNPQIVTVTGASGTFTLTFNGQTIGALAFNATAAQVQSALNGLSSIGMVGGSVTVTKVTLTPASSVFTVTFGGTPTGPQTIMGAAGAGGAVR